MGGSYFISRAPQNTREQAPLYTENRERPAAAAVCVGMKILLSSAGASSAITYILAKKHAENLHARERCLSLPYTSARAGGGCMIFAIVALGRKATGSRESARTARRLDLETRPTASSAVPWKWMVMKSRRTACDSLIQIF